MSMNIKAKGFTLTELLVALAIIGVISVMVLPTIAKINERRKVELGLQRFYSTINQAVRLTKANDYSCSYTRLDQGRDFSYDENFEVLKNCILPNLRYAKAEKCSPTSEKVCVYLTHAGDHFTFHVDELGGDITYCIYAPGKRCKLGETAFRFQFIKGSNYYIAKNNPLAYWIVSKDSVDPYSVNCCSAQVGAHHPTRATACRYRQDVNYATATEEANSLCTIILKNNGWKFPKNYKLK